MLHTTNRGFSEDEVVERLKHIRDLVPGLQDRPPLAQAERSQEALSHHEALGFHAQRRPQSARVYSGLGACA